MPRNYTWKALIKCDGYKCNNAFFEGWYKNIYDLRFCKDCRSKHSTMVLKLQVYEDKYIEDIILDTAKLFKTQNHMLRYMADYLDIAVETLRKYIKKYFDMEFKDFKEKIYNGTL